MKTFFRIIYFYQFLAFFQMFFKSPKILQFRNSQNNYQIRPYKLNLMCEKLSYQFINNLAVNQEVLCYI